MICYTVVYIFEVKQVKLQDIIRCIHKADLDYHMIEDGDRIAVGISGGKDSMVLLTALHMYAKFESKNFPSLPPKIMNIKSLT